MIWIDLRISDRAATASRGDQEQDWNQQASSHYNSNDATKNGLVEEEADIVLSAKPYNSTKRKCRRNPNSHLENLQLAYLAQSCTFMPRELA